jgi:hypothetical protein
VQENKRQIVLGGVAIVLLVVAGWYWFARASGPPAPSSTFTLDGICLACGKDVTATYKAGEGQPATCPLCGKRAVYGTFYCYNCKQRFVPELEPRPGGGPPKMPMIPVCPTCGGTNVAGYIQQDPEHAAAQRGPLPKWTGP